MADKKGKGKHAVILISSSEEEDDIETEEDDDDDDDEEEDYEDSNVSNSSGGETEEEEEVNDSDDNDRTENDESLCNRVIALLKEGCYLESLSLKELKAYLRNHGLRITGTKAVCQQRIFEHWRIKDGKAEALYPMSSFYINCTGDVCKGDVVLFTQKVYKKFDKVTRHGRLLGKRTIAGRVVKEAMAKPNNNILLRYLRHLSFGLKMKVEVLWSKGTNKLPPLFPLLVKGRNLYRLRTYRQRWSDEAERRNVLAEKHKRGDAARLVKAMKRMRKWSADTGTKLQNHSHQSRPSIKRKTTEPESGKIGKAHGKASISRFGNTGKNYQVSSPVGRVKKKQKSSFYSNAGPVLNSYQPQRNFHHRSALHQFAGFDVATTSTMVRSLPSRPYIDPWTIPSSQFLGYNNHNYTHHHNSNHGFYNR